MTNRGASEDARPVPADPSGEFVPIKFEGGRYDERIGLPIFAMAELQRYAKLVSEVAHALYLEQNPKRTRAPRGFAEALDLRLTRVDQGSVVPVLERTTPEATLALHTGVYDAARDLINETFREIDESGRIPESFPPEAIRTMAQFGRSLRDDEHIVLGHFDHTRAVVSRRIREQLGELANLDTIEIEKVLIGRINGLRSDPSHGFDLTLAGPEKRRVEGTFTDPETYTLLAEYLDYGRRAALCSVSVLAQQRTNGDFDITDVLLVESALPRDWSARVVELANLRDGWLERATPAPSPEVIDTIELILARCVDHGVPRPLLFPSGDGGVQAEWREQSATVEVEIFNSRTAEAVSLDADGDVSHERNFLITDIDPIVNFIVGNVK